MTEINSENIELKVDEYGLLHIKFVNLKGQLYGNVFSYTSKSGGNTEPLIVYALYVAELSNISWEETYDVESTQNSDGKYEIQYKKGVESLISYDIFRFTILKGSKGNENKDNIKLKNLNFSILKAYLKEISGLILEALQNILK